MGGSSSKRQSSEDPRVLARQPKPYCWTGEAWEASSSPAAKVETVTVLTYNVWFGEHRFEQRCVEILKILKEENPTLAAFQEATFAFSAAVLADPWVREHYISSDSGGHTLGPYGVMILVRKQPGVVLEEFSMHALETNMSRSLLCAQLRVNGSELVFATVHLESLAHAALRIKQLQTIWPLLTRLAPKGQSMLVGDFNFSDGWEEEKHLSSAHDDLWRRLHHEQPGFTMPASGQWDPWRPDRLLLQSGGPLRATDIKITGTNVIHAGCEDCGQLRRECNPSDHFALVTSLRCTA